MTEFTFEVKDRKVRALMTRYPKEADRLLKNVLRDSLAFHSITMKKSFTPFSRSRRRGRLKSRSGKTRSSIGFVTSKGGERGTVFASGPGVLVQEFGATIRPSRARFLRIPMPDILTGSGVVQGKFLIRRSGRGFITDVGPTFIRRVRGKLYIFVNMPGGRVKAIYALRRSVTVPARFGFGRRFKSETLPFTRKRIKGIGPILERKLAGAG